MHGRHNGARAGGGDGRSVARDEGRHRELPDRTIPDMMPLQGRLLRMAPGDWASPEPVTGGWRPAAAAGQGPRVRASSEQLAPRRDPGVAANAWEMTRNRHFELYLDSKTVFKPTPVENLARIAWPLSRPRAVREPHGRRRSAHRCGRRSRSAPPPRTPTPWLESLGEGSCGGRTDLRSLRAIARAGDGDARSEPG